MDGDAKRTSVAHLSSGFLTKDRYLIILFIYDCFQTNSADLAVHGLHLVSQNSHLIIGNLDLSLGCI